MRKALDPDLGRVNVPAAETAPTEHGWQCHSLGLTPQIAALIGILLLARVLSLAIPDLGAAIAADRVGQWFTDLVDGYLSLVKMVVPIIVIVIGTARLGPQAGRKRAIALTAAVIIGAGIGTLFRVSFGESDWANRLDMIAYVWPRYALLAGLMTLVAEFYRTEVVATRATHDLELDRESLEREMAEARLQVLQAQIEPHFLFNTLANARRLYAEDRASGRMMLDSLMRYLETALPQMRNSDCTLARDAELVGAYLKIQQLRMGQRLAYSIDIPPALGSCYVPPMMLLTLVENAIKHGLAPSPAGGLVRVVARTEAGALILTVADTGIGFGSSSGHGVGLANVSARLTAEFGDSANLMLANNEFGGATATLSLPVMQASERSDGADRSRRTGR